MLLSYTGLAQSSKKNVQNSQLVCPIAQSKNLKKSLLASIITLCLMPAFSAYSAEKEAKSQGSRMETLTVTSHKPDHNQTLITPSVSVKPDISQWLKEVPGAAVNENGKLTGIAQYRGLYGDRVAVQLNGRGIIGAGPNAMDTPLSYSPNITTDTMTVYRGIAPVTAAIESLGGAVMINNIKAQLSTSDELNLSGEAQASYADVNDGQQLALRTNIADDKFGAMLYIDHQEGNDTESGYGGNISPTDYRKIQSGLDIRWQATHNHLLGFSYDYTDTKHAGTPALPMDITSIIGNRFNLDGQYDLKGDALTWQFGYMEADHVMDNFSQRKNTMPTMYRKNTTDSHTFDFSLDYKIQDTYGNTPWVFGIEGYSTEHNATITNPNNTMFEVVNFNEVTESKYSVFTQWNTLVGAHNISSGLRINYAKSDAKDVSHSMAMMNPNIDFLVQQFNSADRSVNDVTFDITSEVQHHINQHLLVSFAIARKERAPSYQERYLWLPMEATGGLADGNTYLGDINLDPEVAYQTNLGLSYHDTQLTFTADVHYQYIDGYIQGTPSEDMTSMMISSMMMGNDNLLQFSNLDARIYGIDGALNYQLDNVWSVKTMVSYVRGKRADKNDNLYRISPFNGDISLQYNTNNWQHSLTMHAVAEQDKVSEINQETESSGYTTFAFKTQYQGFDEWSISAGVDNLFDKAYVNHLAGYNRVNDAMETEKDRISGDGRNAWVALSYSF